MDFYFTQKNKLISVIFGLFVSLVFFSFLPINVSAVSYLDAGIFYSENILNVDRATLINNFEYTASSMPEGTSLKIQFSYDPDGYYWYDADGNFRQWEDLSEGTNSIDLSGLNWDIRYFYYKILLVSDGTDTPVLDSIGFSFIAYDGTYSTYSSGGTLTSENLLENSGQATIDSFGYDISSLPSGTTAKVQFSQDSSSWYDSSGTLDDFDSMSAGSNSISLSSLNWTAPNFYYKVTFSASDTSYTPVLDSTGVTYTITNQNPNAPTLVSPANANTTDDNTPTLSANYGDSDDDDVGHASYRVSNTSLADCTSNTNVVAYGDSSETATNSEDTAWTPDSSIGIDDIYYWCAQNNDGVATSDWTEMGSFTLVTTTASLVEATTGTTEADTTVSLTLELSATSALEISIPYTLTGTATDSTDYTASSSPLTISAGQNSGTINILISEDTDIEDDETIIITLDTPTNATLGATTTLTHTITNDDATISFSVSSQSVAEADGVVELAVTQTGVTATDTTIPFTITGTATDSTDYIASSSPASIVAGATSTTITITPVDDSTVEPDETVIITLGSPTNATFGSKIVHTLTITNDDVAPTVSSASSASNPSGGSSRRRSISETVKSITPTTFIPNFIKQKFPPKKLFEKDAVITPIITVTEDSETESSSEDIQDKDENNIADKKPDNLVRIPSYVEPLTPPSINIFKKILLSYRDGLDTTKYVFSNATHKVISFFKAVSFSSVKLAKGSFRNAKESFISTVTEPEYNPYDDPRIPSKLKDHRYEEIQIVIATADGQPVEGAHLTLLSEPKEATTGSDGNATFSDVPVGEHTLKIAFGNYRGEQALFLKEDVPKLLVAVTPNLQSGVNVWVYLGSLAGVSILVFITTYYLIIKKRMFRFKKISR